MVDIDKISSRIEADEDSVRDSGAGRGRLLEDLRSVPASMVRDVFSRVYDDDHAADKQTIIDMSNGTLVITDAFKGKVAPGKGAATATDSATGDMSAAEADCRKKVDIASQAIGTAGGALTAMALMKKLDSSSPQSESALDWAKRRWPELFIGGTLGGVPGDLVGRKLAPKVGDYVCTDGSGN